MNQFINNLIRINPKKKGFTLLEILLVIAAIGILASIVIVAINPLRQIGKARDTSRQININQIQKALDQYNIANGRYPSEVASGNYGEICETGKETVGGDTDCTDKVDLRKLVPDYIAEIPRDPQGGGYKVGINPANNNISLLADKAEISFDISMNSISLSSGNKDPFFNTINSLEFESPVSIVNALAIQNDNKILIGGNFTSYQGVSTNGIMRFNENGSRDSTFNIGTGLSGGIVRDIAMQPDGKILVGGDFTSYQGVSANRIIRLLANGDRDPNFNIGTGLNYWVHDIEIQADGKILLVGRFTSYQGVSANKIIRLLANGDRDPNFNIGTGFMSDGAFYTKIQADGKILVGGNFTSYNGVNANMIIRLNEDGSIDSDFNIGSGFNTFVHAITIQSDGKILIGGNFTSYQGVSANRIIRLLANGDRDPNFNIGTGFINSVYSGSWWLRDILIQNDNKIIIPGSFTNYNGIDINGIIRLNENGTIDESFVVGVGIDQISGGYSIRSSLQPDGKIVVSGARMVYKNDIPVNLMRLLP